MSKILLCERVYVRCMGVYVCGVGACVSGEECLMQQKPEEGFQSSPLSSLPHCSEEGCLAEPDHVFHL